MRKNKDDGESCSVKVGICDHEENILRFDQCHCHAGRCVHDIEGLEMIERSESTEGLEEGENLEEWEDIGD